MVILATLGITVILIIRDLSDMHHWRGFDDTLVQDLLSFDMRVPFKCDDAH